MKTSLAAAGAAAALLVVVLGWEWLPGEDKVPAVTPPSLHVRGAASEPDTAAKDTEGWAHAIVARPLFSINRRPAKTPQGKNAVAATGLPRLAGIMISQAGKRAIFMPEGGHARTLGEGATLDEYTIRQILADHVVLIGAKGEMVLRPAYDGAHAGENGQGGVPPPGFQPPGFNPGFRPPGFQPMVPPQPPVGNPSDDESGDEATPAPQPVAPQPFPGFRGPFIPRGRNNE